MKINLEYKRPATPEGYKGKIATDSELTLDYITYAVTQKYEKGLDGQLRRIWGRIQRKFDTAIDENKSEIELDEGEKDFILKSFGDAKFDAPIAKYVDILEAELDTLRTK